MHPADDLPCSIREWEHVEIPLSDGCRLAARIWMPEDADQAPRPAILEYIPYRKNDVTWPRDAQTHPWMASHGYVCVRVDLRGSGDSGGVLRDEYLQQEFDDGVEVIEWLAAQPWCDGGVGMIGISWGGFNGLQIAALAPPALKAVVSVCSTDDRYADDVHYMGGCLLNENLSWAAQMFARNSLPPDPRHAGERWRGRWFERLRGTGHWLLPWLEHQVRDDYWRHGSVCEDPDRIQCPVFAVSGWADGYCSAVFRLLERLSVPRRGLVGPWAHTYPHVGRPGPAIDFLDECRRWWDYWLKGRDTGIMTEPMLRAWLQDSARPWADYDERPGRWVGEPAWPAPDGERRILQPTGAGGLVGADQSGAHATLAVSSPLGTGLAAGKWCSYAQPGDQPGEQRPDDGGSLVFDSRPLEAPLDILGDPVLELAVSSDQPTAMVAVRLNDVAPDGASTRVTYGLLNLTHRNGHDRAEALTPGERYRVRVPLKHIGQRFSAGHRLRLAISSSYWPLAWPAPAPVTLEVDTAATRLELPVRAPRPAEEQLRPPGPPVAPREPPTTEVEAPDHSWCASHDLTHGRYTLAVGDGIGSVHFDDAGLTVTKQGTERYSVAEGHPASAVSEARWRAGARRDGWAVETVTETRLGCDTLAFHVAATLRAYENGELCYEQEWTRVIPRNGL